MYYFIFRSGPATDCLRPLRPGRRIVVRPTRTRIPCPGFWQIVSINLEARGYRR